jgi:hypothetical protein
VSDTRGFGCDERDREIKNIDDRVLLKDEALFRGRRRIKNVYSDRILLIGTVNELKRRNQEI